MSVSQKIVGDLVANNIEFITTVPCKQLAGVIDAVEAEPSIHHIPANKEDEGMGLCAGAWMGGKRPAIIMQNTAIGVTINTLATLTQFYRMPLPMLISYRGVSRQLFVDDFHQLAAGILLPVVGNNRNVVLVGLGEEE